MILLANILSSKSKNGRSWLGKGEWASPRAVLLWYDGCKVAHFIQIIFNKSFVYIQQKSFNLKGLHQSELGKQLTSSFWDVNC